VKQTIAQQYNKNSFIGPHTERESTTKHGHTIAADIHRGVCTPRKGWEKTEKGVYYEAIY